MCQACLFHEQDPAARPTGSNVRQGWPALLVYATAVHVHKEANRPNRYRPHEQLRFGPSQAHTSSHIRTRLDPLTSANSLNRTIHGYTRMSRDGLFN
jgi:hypothetical protein